MKFLVLLGIGVLLIGRALYVLMQIGKGAEKFKNQSKNAYVLMIIGVLCVAITPAWFLFFSEHEEVAKKEVVKTPTLNEFINSYTEKAKAIGARYDFDWTVNSGEKTDTVKIKVNDSCSLLLNAKKTDPREVISSVIMIGPAEDKDGWEALFVLYALIQTFEPDRDTQSCSDLVAELAGQEGEHEIQSGIVKYYTQPLGASTIIIISYPMDDA